MKPFRFRLERLMHVKDAERRQRIIELVQRQQVLDEKKRIADDARKRQEDIHGMYISLAGGSSTAGQWLNAERSLLRQAGVVAERARDAQDAAQEVDTARQALIDKSREFETLERLRIRRFEEHTLEQRRTESKENDARAVERYLQTTRAGNEGPDSA